MSSFDLGYQFPAFDTSQSSYPASTSFLITVSDGSYYLWHLDQTTYLANDTYYGRGLYWSYANCYSLDGDSWSYAGTLGSGSFPSTIPTFWQPSDIVYTTISDVKPNNGTLQSGYITDNNPDCVLVTSDDFINGQVGYKYNAFDSLGATSVFSEIFGILPVCLGVLIVYIGLRKAISVLKRIISTA